MLSVHDALEAWKLGKIAPEQAMKLAGVHSVDELHELAVTCDVETREAVESSSDSPEGEAEAPPHFS